MDIVPYSIHSSVDVYFCLWAIVNDALMSTPMLDFISLEYIAKRRTESYGNSVFNYL